MYALAEVDFAAQLAEQAVALGDHSCAVDRSQGSPWARTNVFSSKWTEALDGHADHLLHAVLDEAGLEVPFSDNLLHLVRALHQLVDLGAIAASTISRRASAWNVSVGALRTADVRRAYAALVVRGYWHRLDQMRDLAGV